MKSALALVWSGLGGFLPRRRSARLTARLAAAWGTPRADPREVGAARALAEVDVEPEDDSYRIDARTWGDLDMDLVFQALDRTLSPPGCQRLYQLLATPRLSRRELDGRERLIGIMQRDPDARLAVQRQLLRLENEQAWDVPALLWRDIPASPVPLLLLRVLSWALPVVALLGFWFPGLWFAAMALFGTNIVFELWLERTVATHMAALWYLQRVLATARAVSARPIAGLEKEQNELAAHLEGTQALSRKVLLVSVNDRFDVTGFFRAALLANSIVFFQARELILRQRAQLRAVYKAIGLLDAAQAIASFRAQHADHVVPAFAAGRLRVENIRHPALAAPVGNDLELPLSRGLLVTGSNMSGKTTFLKTIGLSAILAQTIHTVRASRYELGFVRVMSSVDTLDDISRGKSYYMDEVESVLRLVRAAGAATPALFIVDEVFRGTNPVERVAAATEVLRYLARNDLVLAATHDLEICALLAERFDTVHFREEVTEVGLRFDYALRPGACVSRNAIALLRVTGYPAEIVDAASRRAGRRGNRSG